MTQSTALRLLAGLRMLEMCCTTASNLNPAAKCKVEMGWKNAPESRDVNMTYENQQTRRLCLVTWRAYQQTNTEGV
jgi:hypothetical protein